MTPILNKPSVAVNNLTGTEDDSYNGGVRMEIREFTKGFIRTNPVFVLMLGLCPTLATSTSIENGFMMGMSATAVLLCSNVIISLIKNFIPKGVRIPCYIVVIATFVTITDLLLQGFFPDIAKALGIFVPLIVVNCIVLGRAEAFASKRAVGDSFLDGLGLGLGFTSALMLIALIREILGNGTLLGYKVSTLYNPMAVLTLAPGAFLVIGLLMGVFNYIGERKSQ